ncbi:hypothetical protein [Plastoroseomonas arctica]|uniref:hypothetical protein n=1 Tax=Plastoroseomonas arctica TaxID=1509237 RepID=UPI001BAAE723|nr:hypothetical protein [Plastoroseomonas arctica]
MQTSLAEAIIAAAMGYGAVGLAIGAAFLVFGIGRLDGGAHGAYAFRPLLLPGLALLWPYVVWRWSGGAAPGFAGQRRHRAAHRWAWIGLAVLLPALFLTALSLRTPVGDAPVRIAAP